MKSKDDKVLFTRELRIQTAITPPRQLLQSKGDGLIYLRQDREQTVGTWEQETHVKEAHIISAPNSEPFCEDLKDVLDELGQILDEEQADFAFDLRPEITPPPPPICLDDDESLFTRRSNSYNDCSTTNIDKSLEILDRAKNLKKFIENRTSQIIELPESHNHNKPKSSAVNAGHDKIPEARSSSKDNHTSQAKSTIESNRKSARLTFNERRSIHTRSKTYSSISKSKDIRSVSDRYRSQSMQRNSPIRSRDWKKGISQASKYCRADQKRRRSKSTHLLDIRNRRSQSKQRNSPIRYRARRSIFQKRHRSKSSDRVKVRTRRRSSPRERLNRRPTGCRSRSPQNMRRSNYIKNPHTIISERSCAEGIQRRRNSSLSPRRSHDFRRMHISRYSPLRLPQHRSRSRSNTRKFLRSCRSRSRSPRLKFPIRNVCNNRYHPAKIAVRSRSRSTDRSGSRSVSSPSPLRERSRSMDRPSNCINDPRVEGRTLRLRIQHTSRRKSPSQSALDDTMTATFYPDSQPGEQILQPMKISSPVNSSPRLIVPMITLHNNTVTRPTSLRRQLLPTPTASHMLYMQTHFANIEYRNAPRCQVLRLPYGPTPANLAPIDLRHRLLTSRSLCYLGPNDLRHRIQDLYVQNTYLPPPAFHTQWLPDYSIDYSSSGYY